MDDLSLVNVCCMCTSTVYWDGPIPHPLESCRACMCHWVSSGVTKPSTCIM